MEDSRRIPYPYGTAEPHPHDVAGPVLLTADPALEADVRRLGAAAGSALAVTADTAEVLTRWGHAALVLVGVDLLDAVARLGPDRRDGVHVLSGGPAGAQAFRNALAVSAETVTELPEGDEWLTHLLADAGEAPRPVAPTVGVIGGAGGAGASVFAAALALEAADRTPTLLVDADPCGAGAERVVGIEDHAGVSWGALTASGRLSARALREALPGNGRLSVLGFAHDAVEAVQPPPLAACREVVAAARRGFGLVVADLPRHPGDVADELLVRCDELVVVSTLTLAAVAATARLRSRIPTGRGLFVARGRDRGVDPETAARAVGLPLIATMADQRGVDESIALGLGPGHRGRGPLARAARDVLDELGVTGSR